MATEKNVVLLLGKILQKSAKTISRELERGMVEHEKREYSLYSGRVHADHAQLDAEEKMKHKGPRAKSGKHYTLIQRISELILEHKYSPYAVLQQLDEENLWPEGL